jgi:hypothetical protein
VAELSVVQSLGSFRGESKRGMGTEGRERVE